MKSLIRDQIDTIQEFYVENRKTGVLKYQENEFDIEISGIREINRCYRWLRYNDRLSNVVELNIVNIPRNEYRLSTNLLVYLLDDGTIFITFFGDLSIFFAQYVDRQHRLLKVPIYFFNYSEELEEIIGKCKTAVKFKRYSDIYTAIFGA